MSKNALRTTLAGALLTVGAVAGLSGVAGATATETTGPAATTGPVSSSGPGSARLDRAKVALEKELALRATRLASLVSDVSGAKTLSVVHATELTSRLQAEQADIAALIAKVPTDTTMAEVNADRASMLKDNRVFAVMSPQVFETIGGDAVLSSDSVLQSEQSSLLAEVNSLAGQPGYKNALDHYNNFVQRINGVATRISAEEVVVLSQTPEGWPADQHVFVTANHAILNANVSLAYATYDASVISLATGGYTGS